MRYNKRDCQPWCQVSSDEQLTKIFASNIKVTWRLITSKKHWYVLAIRATIFSKASQHHHSGVELFLIQASITAITIFQKVGRFLLFLCEIDLQSQQQTCILDAALPNQHNMMVFSQSLNHCPIHIPGILLAVGHSGVFVNFSTFLGGGSSFKRYLGHCGYYLYSYIHNTVYGCWEECTILSYAEMMQNPGMVPVWW